MAVQPLIVLVISTSAGPTRDLEPESGDLIALAQLTFIAARERGMNSDDASKHTAKVANVDPL